MGNKLFEDPIDEFWDFIADDLSRLLPIPLTLRFITKYS